MSAIPFDGFAKVTFTVARQIGQRGFYAGLTLSAKAAADFKFSSATVWPQGEGYEEAVREGIVEAMTVHGQGLLAAEVRVEEIEWQPVDSSPGAFRFAARQAMNALLVSTGAEATEHERRAAGGCKG